jgi:hypothetical protein
VAYTIPTVSDFKNYFVRDFPYGTEQVSVMDSDISRAIVDAGINFNEALWSTQATYNVGFLLLTAHYLVLNLRASAQGIQGQYEWLLSSKGVGSVSVGISIPDRILNNPTFSMLTKTTYGAQYLEYVMPQLVGNMYAVCGRTSP